MTDRRTLLAAAVAVPFVSAPGLSIAATSLLTLDYEKGVDYSTLTVACPAARKITSHLLKGREPHRFLIDLEGCRLTAEIERSAKALKLDRFVSRVRVGQFKADTLRIVVELKHDVSAAPLMGSTTASFGVRFAASSDIIAVIAEQAERTAAATKPSTKPVKKTTAAAGKETIRVVIDPGHGGADPGAVGRSKTYEKTVVLAIAKKLAAQINRTRGMQAILTRSEDRFLKLHKRAQVAVDQNAHLFVSIHADAWTSKTACGASVFTLSAGGASSLQARWLAQSQNKSDEIGGVDVSAVPKQAQSTIVDLQAELKQRAGIEIGDSVLKEMKGVERLHKDAVEYAEFAVLKARGIPSILIETGFLSNPDDERRLKSESHQNKIAQAVCKGIIRAIREKPCNFVQQCRG